MAKNEENKFMLRAIELAEKGMNSNKGGPFGAVVVKGNKIIGEGFNTVTSSCDPTAHAEVIAIRDACKNLGTFVLDKCEIYCTCEPCPMCLGAIYWARIDNIYYAANRKQAADGGFDDDFIYTQIPLSPSARTIISTQIMAPDGVKLLQDWNKKPDKTLY